MRKLDIHLNGDNDQTTVCPKCGCRTIWDDPSDILQGEFENEIQVHTCISCNYQFILEFDQVEKHTYIITAEPAVPVDEITDFDEIGCLGDEYTIEAEDEEAAWDRFHDTVAIANVSDFHLSIRIKS